MKNKILFCVIVIFIAIVAFLVGLGRHKVSYLIIDKQYQVIGTCDEARRKTITDSDTGELLGVSFNMKCFCSLRSLADNAQTPWISAMYPGFESSYCQPDDEKCIEKEISYLTENCPRVCPYTCAAIFKNVWKYGYTFKESE